MMYILCFTNMVHDLIYFAKGQFLVIWCVIPLSIFSAYNFFHSVEITKEAKTFIRKNSINMNTNFVLYETEILVLLFQQSNNGCNKITKKDTYTLRWEVLCLVTLHYLWLKQMIKLMQIYFLSVISKNQFWCSHETFVDV